MPSKGKIKTEKHMEKVLMVSLQHEGLNMFLIGYAEASKQATRKITKYPIRTLKEEALKDTFGDN